MYGHRTISDWLSLAVELLYSFLGDGWIAEDEINTMVIISEFQVLPYA